MTKEELMAALEPYFAAVHNHIKETEERLINKMDKTSRETLQDEANQNEPHDRTISKG